VSALFVFKLSGHNCDNAGSGKIYYTRKCLKQSAYVEIENIPVMKPKFLVGAGGENCPSIEIHEHIMTAENHGKWWHLAELVNPTQTK